MKGIFNVGSKEIVSLVFVGFVSIASSTLVISHVAGQGNRIPGLATNVNVVGGDSQIIVTWDPPTFDGGTGTGISLYMVAWRRNPTERLDKEYFTPSDERAHVITRYYDEPIQNGREYFVKVFSYNSDNMGSQTAEFRVVPGATGSLSGLSISNVTANSADVFVSVAGTTSDVRAIHLRYRMASRANWPGGGWEDTLRFISSAARVRFELQDLYSHTAYDVQVSLFATFPTGEYVSGSFMTSAGRPSSPRNLLVTHGDRELSMGWSSPGNDGGAPITGYVVEWKSGDQGYSSSRRMSLDVGTSTTEIFDLTNGVQYTIRVIAVNAYGNGLPAEANAIPSTVPASPPSGTIGSSCDGSLVVSWQPPIDDGGSPITSYTIQWKSEPDGDYYFADRQVVVNATTLIYRLTQLTNGTEYTFRVLASNENEYAPGFTDAKWSNEVTETPRVGVCVSGLSFEDVTQSSVRVFVRISDAEGGSEIYLRYRSRNGRVWGAQRRNIVQAGETLTVFGISGLSHSTEYEVEASVDRRFDTDSTVRGLFVTETSPETSTPTDDSQWDASGGFVSRVARIKRIEPVVSSFTINSDDKVIVSVDVYGRQDILDNGLADRSPEDRRPMFEWTSTGGGKFKEICVKIEWRNSGPDDPEMMFVAPETGGRLILTAVLRDPADRQPWMSGETEKEWPKRCSAKFNVLVRRVTESVRARVEPRIRRVTYPSRLSEMMGRRTLC